MSERGKIFIGRAYLENAHDFLHDRAILWRDASIADGEAVVENLLRVGDTHGTGAGTEEVVVGEEFAFFGEIDKGANACFEMLVELRHGMGWAVGVF